MYTLTKTIFGKHGRCVIGPETISNGHWAVRTKLVINRTLFASVKVAEDFGLIDSLTSKSTFLEIAAWEDGQTLKKYHRTKWLFESTPWFIRIYENNKGECLGINDRYATFFDSRDVLFACGPLSPAVDNINPADANVIMMPFSLNGVQPLTIQQKKP